RTMMVDVLTNEGKTVGCTAVGTRSGEFVVITAPTVIMATGSTCRHLEPELPTSRYKMKYHHCPSAITGDGMAAAYRAGAELANMDLMEGSVPHMDYTCITRGCLIGVRPVKTKEYTCDGEDLYTRNPNELSKKMFRTLDEMGKTPIYRGMDHLPEEMQAQLQVNYIDEGFINMKLAGERGFNPKDHRFEVPRDKPYPPDASAVQMPGLAVDENYMTTVPGLYAVGDAASCVGAVMSAIVTGYTVGDVVGDYVANAGEIRLDDAQVQKQMDETLAPLSVSAEDGTDPIEFECAVRQYDERYVGIFKSAGKLRAGLRRLESLKKEFIPKLYAANPHYLMRCIEAKNIADMAGVYMQACMSREETRGFFNRADFQEKDPERNGKITYQRLENGVPVVEKRAAPKLKAEFGGNA
ncbi:MAG: FAD-binding protein, partial [Oscillospiraceae bacterium]